MRRLVTSRLIWICTVCIHCLYTDVWYLLIWLSVKSLLHSLGQYIRLVWGYTPLSVLTKRQSRLRFVESYGEPMIKPRIKERILDLCLSDGRRRRRLLQWVHSRLVSVCVSAAVSDFCRSWQDGLALCALLEAICPGACPGYHLLVPHNRVKNCRLGLKLANKYMYVPLDILEPEEMAIADKNTERKIIEYVFMLKWSSENIKDKWSTLHGNLIAAKTGHCFAKGAGLRNGIVGSKLKFNIIVSDTIGVFNLRVEVRGPNNEYSGEQIVSLHQAQGILDKSPGKQDHETYTYNPDDYLYLEDSVGNTFVRQQIRLRQEIDPNYSIFLDSQCGDEGTFYISYAPRRAGIHVVMVKWQGNHVEGSPFRVKVYNSSNLVSHNLKGAQEKRVIYDSLSFTSVDGGSSEGSVLQGSSSFENSDVISGERSVASISKSKAYTAGRQLTVTRRRVLRRIITRNGEDIVIEETISPSVSRQSSFTDNSDEDTRIHANQKDTINPNALAVWPAVTRGPAKCKETTRTGQDVLGTVTEEKDRRYSFADPGKNLASVDSTAVTVALNKHILKAQEKEGAVSGNDVTDPDDGGSDVRDLPVKGTKQTGNGNVSEPTHDNNNTSGRLPVNASQESDDMSHIGTQPADATGKLFTDVKRTSVKRKPLLKRSDPSHGDNSLPALCYDNETAAISFYDSRKRIANRTTSDGQIYELRKQMSPLLSSPSECSSDGYCADGTACTNAADSFLYPVIVSYPGEDVLAPKTPLRETRSLPLHMPPGPPQPDFTANLIFPAYMMKMDHRENQEKPINVTTLRQDESAGENNDTESLPKEVRRKFAFETLDKINDSDKSQIGRQSESTNKGKCLPNGNGMYSYAVESPMIVENDDKVYSVAKILHKKSQGSFASDAVYADLIEKGTHQNMMPNGLTIKTDIERIARTATDPCTSEDNLAHKLDNTQESSNTETNTGNLGRYEKDGTENATDVRSKDTTHHVTVFETKISGIVEYDLSDPTDIIEAKIIITPSSHSPNRRNLMRQECRDKGSSEYSSSVDSDKHAPNSQTGEVLQTCSQYNISEPSIFRSISEVSKTGIAPQYTSEVHIVIPTAKVDKSTQVTSTEITTETGWDIIERVYAFLNRLFHSISAPEMSIDEQNRAHLFNVLDTEKCQSDNHNMTDHDKEYIVASRIRTYDDTLTAKLNCATNLTEQLINKQNGASEIRNTENFNQWFQMNDLLANRSNVNANKRNVSHQEEAAVSASEYNNNEWFHMNDLLADHNNVNANKRNVSHEEEDVVSANEDSSTWDDNRQENDTAVICNPIHYRVPQHTLTVATVDHSESQSENRVSVTGDPTLDSAEARYANEASRHGRLSWPLIRYDNGHIRLFRRPYRGCIELDRKLVTSSLESMEEDDDSDYDVSSLEDTGTREKITRRRRFQYRREDSFSLSDSELDIRSRTRSFRRLDRRSREKSSNFLTVHKVNGSNTDGVEDSLSNEGIKKPLVGNSDDQVNIEKCDYQDVVKPSDKDEILKSELTQHIPLTSSRSASPDEVALPSNTSECSSYCAMPLETSSIDTGRAPGNVIPVNVPVADHTPAANYNSLSSFSIDSSYSGFGVSKPMRCELLSGIDEFRCLFTAEELGERQLAISNEVSADETDHRNNFADYACTTNKTVDPEQDETEVDRYSGTCTQKELSWAAIDTIDYYSAVELDEASSITDDSDNVNSEQHGGVIEDNSDSGNGDVDVFPFRCNGAFDMFPNVNHCFDDNDCFTEVFGNVLDAREGDCNLPRIRVDGAGLTGGYVGTRNCFHIWTEHLTAGSPSVTIVGPQPQTVRETSVLFTGDNLYEVFYEVTRPGLYTIYVKVNDEHVASSPYRCEVTF